MPHTEDFAKIDGNVNDSSLRASFGSNLRKLFQTWMLLQKKLIRKEGITFGHLFFLRKIKAAGDLNLSNMAEYIGESRSAITGITDTLEKKGLVMRVRDDDDRRQIRVVLTDESKSLLRRLESERDHLMTELIAAIPADTLEKLNNSLAKVVQKLNGTGSV